ncbi:FAD:protein FMN transferase [Lysobacter xanthus]
MDVARRERARPWLGTTVVVRVAGPDAVLQPAIGAAFSAIEAVHRSMSFHEAASDLARLNRDAFHATQPVPRPLARVLRAALALARASAGRFDPTVAARLVASGHLPRPDGPEPDPHAGWRDIDVDAVGRVRFRRPLWIDLGGIAKGYAVDRAVDAARRAGATGGVVNAGGDLRVFGDMPETFAVRDPRDPAASLALATVRDAAIATSGGYFSARGDDTVLVDMPRGARVARVASVSVCAPRAIWADALTKVAAADEAAATPLLRQLHAHAARIDADGSVRTWP